MDTNDFRNERKKIRRKERLARKEHHRMSKLEDNLLASVPSGLVPGNVGKFDDVCWPFDYTVAFNFGDNPSYGPALPVAGQQNTTATPSGGVNSFQVTQEAAFICGSISRKCFSGTTSGELAPLQMIIRDRQSTRQFMDFAIPIQGIAKKTPPTIWELPLIFMPNAFVDVIVTSWLPAAQATLGSGRMVFTFSGYRTRTQDIGTVLSTVFGRV